MASWWGMNCQGTTLVYPSLAVCLWASYLAALCLLFLECKTRKDCVRIYLQLCSDPGWS